ncbi:hypothetical protein rsdtw13_11290 [Clostridium sp. TW13]|uniref:Uncharacterized protein n=1 Tax=Inconstantimicrobium mannanitabidum TaxID=1604901 RepID=A0ACB5RA08_9CLOT|nr:hypothetical protein rsdtw13_11290 [Clostridium sp. TW13]
MNSATWIAIYLPIFMLLFVILPQQRNMQKFVIKKNKNRKGLKIMTNEILKKYIGKECRISTGSLGTNVAGKIVDINENWIEVETKKGMEVINAEFIQSIKII